MAVFTRRVPDGMYEVGGIAADRERANPAQPGCQLLRLILPVNVVTTGLRSKHMYL